MALAVPSPLLQVSSLVKRFGQVEAVAGLDLEVGAGELIALLGPNGAGKTTTIRMLIGQLQPSGGQARVAGFDCFADRAEVMRWVGYLPDEPTFYDHLTGRELIRFVGGLHGLSAASIGQRATSLAERLELAGDLDEYAMNYSTGMRKKLALILALLHQPALLILDEPMNGLDPYAMRTVGGLLREAADAGTTVLFSTHLMDQAERLCRRAAIIARGRKLADGTIDDLRTQAAAGGSLEQAFFAVTAAEQPAAVQTADLPEEPGPTGPAAPS